MEAKKTIWFGRPVETTIELDKHGREVRVQKPESLFEDRVAVIKAGEEIPAELLQHRALISRLKDSGAAVGDIPEVVEQTSEPEVVAAADAPAPEATDATAPKGKK